MRDSVVLRWVSAAARDSVLTALSASDEGMVCYLKDIDRFEYYTGGRWAPMGGQCIARGNRTTSSTTTTSEIGVIRISAALKAGQVYLIKTSPLLLYSNTSGDFVFGRLRYTTDGSTPSTSSTILTSISGYAGASQTITPLVAKYVPSSDITFGLLLTTGRSAGSGTVGVVANSNVPDIDLMIMAAGADPGDTGVDI